MRQEGNLLPFPVMNVEKKHIDGCTLAVITVAPSENPPVRYNGRVWVRIGPRRAQASAEEENRLVEKKRWGNLSFDRHPVKGATLQDLDLEWFRRNYFPSAVSPEVLEENNRSVEQQLAALHFIAPDGSPNTAAVLMFGKEPQYWLPGAYIQFLRIDGNELSDPIKDQKQFTGTIHNIIQQMDIHLKEHIRTSLELTGSINHRQSPDYPIIALQQITRNALLHRNYESTNAPVRIYWFNDRIEVHSPGGPFGQVNEENFGQPGITDYRNPLIAESMKHLGYVEKFGFGIIKAEKELHNNDNQPLEKNIQPSYVLIVIKGRSL
jgi:ATP-dependent DNA helicase RecG